MTPRTSGALALDQRLSASGAAVLAPTFAPARRIRPAAQADRHVTREGERFVARPVIPAPDTSRLRARALRLVEAIGDRMGIPTRDAAVLAAAVAVVGSMFGTAMAVTSDPAPSYQRQLEAQHSEWLATQVDVDGAVAQAPVATMASDG